METDRALIPALAPSIRYLTVTITAPDAARRTDRPAVNVAFVVDRSGSMAGRKIEMAREAATHAVRLLDARDRLGVVAYDHEVTTVLDGAPASPEAKALAIARLNAIDARGNTNLDGGWLRGLEIVAASSAAGSEGPAAVDVVHRVLLLSDGLANAGETNPDALARRAAEFRARGIATSTFGIGADFDEVLMSRLATDGGGHFYYVENARQIPDFLTSELGETLEIVAPDARLVVSCGPGVDVAVFNDFVVESRPEGVHVRIGDLVAGQEVTVVLAVRCEARPVGADAFVNCRLTDRRSALFPGAMRVDWRAADAAAEASQAVNTRVLVTAAEQVAARERLAAVAANRQGDFRAAAERLRLAATLVRDIGRDVPAIDRLARELEEEAARFGEAMSPSALKHVHFAAGNLRVSREPDGKARRRVR